MMYNRDNNSLGCKCLVSKQDSHGFRWDLAIVEYLFTSGSCYKQANVPRVEFELQGWTVIPNKGSKPLVNSCIKSQVAKRLIRLQMVKVVMWFSSCVKVVCCHKTLRPTMLIKKMMGLLMKVNLALIKQLYNTWDIK